MEHHNDSTNILTPPNESANAEVSNRIPDGRIPWITFMELSGQAGVVAL
jgi:hypothetical protein